MLDTNVVVSAFIRPDGPPGQIVKLLLAGEVELVTCPAMVDELRRTLTRPGVRKYLLASRPELVGRLAQLEALANLVQGTGNIEIQLRDPDDVVFLVAAVEGRAGFLVTGDADLLVVGRYEDVHIVTPRTFLDWVKADAAK